MVATYQHCDYADSSDVSFLNHLNPGTIPGMDRLKPFQAFEPGVWLGGVYDGPYPSCDSREPEDIHRTTHDGQFREAVWVGTDETQPTSGFGCAEVVKQA